MQPIQGFLRLSPARITGSYIIVEVIWILLSDWLVAMVSESQVVLTQSPTAKGWLYIAGSGLLIFGLTRTREHQVRKSQQQLEMSNQQLQVLHRIFRHNIRNDLTVIQGHIDMVLESLQDATERNRLITAKRACGQYLE